jgi:hypothetical protein
VLPFPNKSNIRASALDESVLLGASQIPLAKFLRTSANRHCAARANYFNAIYFLPSLFLRALSATLTIGVTIGKAKSRGVRVLTAGNAL